MFFGFLRRLIDIPFGQDSGASPRFRTGLFGSSDRRFHQISLRGILLLPFTVQIFFETPRPPGDVIFDLTILTADCPPLISPSAAAKLGLSSRSTISGNLGLFYFPEPSPQESYCRGFILMLRAFAIAPDLYPGWPMRDLDAAIGLVSSLPAWPGSPGCGDIQVSFFYVELSLGGLSKDCHGHS